MSELEVKKSAHALREEAILATWKEKAIFEKTLAKESPKGEFIFYEGPPTANGHPGIHHLEARAFKDAIPRYKTMQGFHVRRKGGWDTHGLPVELQVEKELGLKSKKEIESYGVAAFNDKCKASVWSYVHEWAEFTDRMGYWVDLKHPYVTYKPAYIEALWDIVAKVYKQDLLYKDFRVVPWCPKDQTVLSSHELAQGYETVKDLAVTVKFKVKSSKFKVDGPTYFLAWTTTPWTLPGNVALAVGEKVEYVLVKDSNNEQFILAKARFEVLKDKFVNPEVIQTLLGKDLIGLEYEPLYPFLRDNVSGAEKEKLPNAFKVYAADFVTTTDGTGIVHTAVMYGQDDFGLGTKVGLPKHHLVNEDGTFKAEAGFLAGAFVKDPNTDVAIIKDLANRSDGSLLFAKEKYEHSYPHCWRCHTPLIYFARDSWYIRMSALRNKLVKENESIHWEPEHIREGRFGEWLREVKDWAISRERYWGTPLPVWNCEKCNERKVVSSVADVTKPTKNTYYVMRHGEAENNVRKILAGDPKSEFHLTDKGKSQVAEAAKEIKKLGIDLVYVSPFIRTQETLAIVKDKLGWDKMETMTDYRLSELASGTWNGRDVGDFIREFEAHDRFVRAPEGGENYADIKRRMGEFIYDVENKQSGKTILIITHETPACLLYAASIGMHREETIIMRDDRDFLGNAEIKQVPLVVIPHNPEYELDLHRPYIDEVVLTCECGGDMKRVKEVMDVWFDSGAMPFAQDHELGIWDFKGRIKSGFSLGKFLHKQPNYPADFIAEAIDQTRGWFYTLHAVGTLLGVGKAYKNVVSVGHVLDKEGKKMSKSIGNVVNPWEMMDKYGADALRLWMYSVNQPGDSKNFDEKTVDEINKKVFNLAANVLSFYSMYAGPKSNLKSQISKIESRNVLDLWIDSRLNQLIETVTKGLDDYKFFEPTRAIKDFIADLSQWYLRRSRDRFKGENQEDKMVALLTTRHILLSLSKIMAPMAPFFAEYLYEAAGGHKESVHLEDWPEAGKVDGKLLTDMELVRKLSSQGLEARMIAKINVRQPLANLKSKNSLLRQGSGGQVNLKNLSPELIELIKDEVNVKQVTFEEKLTTDVLLDTNISPALKAEGMVRELLRLIQDLRKEKGLSVNDRAVLQVDTNGLGRKLIEDHAKEIKSTCSLDDIKYGATAAASTSIGDIQFALELK